MSAITERDIDEKRFPNGRNRIISRDVKKFQEA